MFADLRGFLHSQNVHAHLKTVSLQPDSPPATLLVDAAEFAGHVCRAHAEHSLQLAVGEYWLFGQLIEVAVKDLLARNVSLCFLFREDDAANASRCTSPFEETIATLAQRERTHLVLACQNGYSKKSLPPPLLWSEQLRDTLSSLMSNAAPGRISVRVDGGCPDVFQLAAMESERRQQASGDSNTYILSDNRYILSGPVFHAANSSVYC